MNLSTLPSQPVGSSRIDDVPEPVAVDEAVQLMTDRRIRHLPVVRNERLTGFVSIGDLVKWKIAKTEAEAEAMKSYLSSQF